MILQVGDFWAYDARIQTRTRFVKGNHERWHRIERRDFAENIELLDDYEVYEFGALSFGCLGRIQRKPIYENARENGIYLGEKPRIWLRESVWGALNLWGSDVLVFHDRPVLGEGEEDFLGRLTRVLRPRLVLHGHIHEFDVSEPFDGTTVVALPPCDPVRYNVDHEAEVARGDLDAGFVLDTEEEILYHGRKGRIPF